ncbi:hypothetical protein KFK09_027444 [Dendrobium nobile]|uniref:Uncharacterized protein n=1 Tax=Dendrobium nobile TaxID=94219 RepID=A0A8T3AAJ5_DENNO|nr:hypothetical protein KFK09_027444 [Dendrobium nobile]
MEKNGNLEEFMDAEEITDSECSSGCQSGWTLYLGQSQESFTASRQQRTGKEEEDLSMLSDASSGPPLLHENNNNSFCSCCYNERDGCLCNDSFLTLTEVTKYVDKRRSFEEQKQQKERSFGLLEDTASSPVFSCYKATNNSNCSSKKLLNAEIMEQSCSLSENHFKRKIELQKQLGYLNSFCTGESSSGLQRRR